MDNNTKDGDIVIDRGIADCPDPEQPAARSSTESIRFDGRVAVVTGAGAGLGRIYALELAKRGAKVVVNDLGGSRDGSGQGSSSPADQVVQEILALGGNAVASYHSVSTPEGGQAIVNRAVEAFGRVDILINNAGILRDKTLVKMGKDEWDAVMAVHLDGAFHVTRHAFLKMRENSYGRIIVTTSASGLYGNFGQANYSAAKMGLVGFMNALRLEGEKNDIKINAVAPLAATRMTEDILPQAMQDKLKPEFVAPLVLYLCSEHCPVTGAVYNAGMGHYSRVAIMTGSGAVLGDGKEAPSPEDICRNMDKINAMDGAREFRSLMDILGAILEASSKSTRA